MKKVLYITNIQVPYRVRFFNELAKYCDLTVLYERSKSGNRDSKWSTSIDGSYEQYFLDGVKIGNESCFSLRILKYILKPYDVIILGCYSTPVQIFANYIMRLFRRPFTINFDGEVFADDESIKSKIKKIVIKGARSYVIAGEQAAYNLKKIVGNKKITPYFFSSLSDDEIYKNDHSIQNSREDFILVVGQYFEYKGLDVALDVAKKLPNQKFKFVGMGKRTQLFIEECKINQIKNVEVVPFLQQEDLFNEYKKCKCLLLPTRQECWGLVVNEAASFGTPIVSTYGSGAAVEFLSDKYNSLLAKPGDSESLIQCLSNLTQINIQDYSSYLIEKSKHYSIDVSVREHLKVVGEYYE